MDYLKTLVANYDAPIHNSIKLIKQLPVTHKLPDFYKHSSKNELMFIGAATFFTLYKISSRIKSKRQKLNLPPTIPFAFPFVGHIFYLIYTPSRFLDWCNEKYGDIYNLYIFGNIITVTSGKSAEETLTSDASELSLDNGVIRNILHLHYVFDEPAIENGKTVTPAVARKMIASSKISMYVTDIQDGLVNACEAMLKEKSTLIEQPSPFFQNLIAYMSVPSLIGAEFALHTEVIDTFSQFTGDVARNVGYFVLTPTFLHKYMRPYLQSTQKHFDTMLKYIIPAVLERREIMKLAKDAGEDHGLVENFFQGLIESVKTDENGVQTHLTPEQIAHSVLLTSFASVHTTSMSLSFAVYWLLARPDLMEKLMDEIKQIVPGSDDVVTPEALSKMTFLNNFLREALRQGEDKIANGRRAMHDYTFFNGYQIPKGRMVLTSLRQLNFGDNSTRVKIEEMDPRMSLNKACTAPAKDFVSFGMGKHLCPGRFFALQEIGMSLVYLLKNYSIKTASGKRPVPVKVVAGVMAANCEEPLVFTRKM